MSDVSTRSLDIRRLRFRYAVDGADATGGASADRDADGAPHAAAATWIVDIPELALARGEQMLLTGGSGSGKSTLLHLIAGLLDPTQGSVRVAGTDIHQARGAKRDLIRGREIGMIFQTFNLLPGFTALENVMLALLFSGAPSREHRPRAATLLNELGLVELDRAVEGLSVGQQQRVAVARAVACSPTLVLADEPTASLDPATAATAMDLIQQTCARLGAALLCTSHDPAMAERFERRTSLAELASFAERPRART